MLCLVLAVLLAQAPVAAAPGAPPAAAAESNLSGTATLGGVLLTGNSDSTSLAFGASLTWKTTDWIVGFKASAAYGRSTDPSTHVESTSALNGAISARGARRLNPLLAIYLEGIVETDHLKSIEARPAAELGASLQLIDRKDGDFQSEALRVDLGVRGGYEYRFQYYPVVSNLADQEILAPKAGAAFRYAITRATILGDEINALLNVPDGPRLLLTNVIKLSTQLYTKLSFSVSYGIAEDSKPPVGKKQLDTTLMVAFDTTI